MSNLSQCWEGGGGGGGGLIENFVFFIDASPFFIVIMIRMISLLDFLIDELCTDTKTKDYD